MPPLERMSTSLNGGSIHSPQRGGKPKLAYPTTTSSCSSSSNDRNEIEVKAAQEGCIGSLQALVHYLSNHGVSASSVAELQQSIRSGQYHAVLLKIQKYYLKCLPITEFEATHCLVLGCWNTQYRYAQIQYQAAYQYYHTLRFGHGQHTAKGTSRRSMGISTSLVITNDIEMALQKQIYMAEQVCACQKEIILCNRRYEQQCQL
jgi:hypothetical protein